MRINCKFYMGQSVIIKPLDMSLTVRIYMSWYNIFAEEKYMRYGCRRTI